MLCPSDRLAVCQRVLDSELALHRLDKFANSAFYHRMMIMMMMSFIVLSETKMIY